MAEQTHLSLMTLHDDGTATHRAWTIPAEAAADLGAVLVAAYGEASESISSAGAVRRIVALDVPGMVDL